MAFDKTQPTDTTKLRNLGVVIRPNWVAIEEADSTFRPYALNFQNRTPLGVSNDPASIADTSIIYCKDDADGNPELFAEDASANIVQLTQAGAIGSSTSALSGSSITFDKGVFTNNQDAMCTAWSYVVVSGTSISTQTNYGMSWARTGTGLYTATFTASQVTNANYVIVGTAFTSPGGSEGTNLSLDANKVKNTTNFSIQLKHSTSDNQRDRSFMVAVFGGR